MRLALLTSLVLSFVVTLGCGGSGYEKRKAAPGEADPSAAMKEMNTMGGGPAKPAK